MRLIKILCFYTALLPSEEENLFQIEYRCLQRFDQLLGAVYDIELVQYSPQEGFRHERVAAFTSLRSRARTVTRLLYRQGVTCAHLRDVLSDLA